MVDRFVPCDRRTCAFIPAFALIVAAPFFAVFIAAPGWQLKRALGICTAATVLEVGTLVEGGRRPTLAGLFVGSAISGTAFFCNRRFAHDADATISGHHDMKKAGP